MDFADVRAQEHVKRALEIAAVGNLRTMIVGAPGTDRWALLKAAKTIWPDLETATALAGWVTDMVMVTIHTPCPCGFYTHHQRECICRPEQIALHQHELAQPQPAIAIETAPMRPDEYMPGNRETSGVIAKRVTVAREFAVECGRETFPLTRTEVDDVVRGFDDATLPLAQTAAEQFQLCSHGWDSMIRAARACADLEGAGRVGVPHLAEAAQYRSLIKSWY